MWRSLYRLIGLNLFWNILTISSWGRRANRRVMLMTLGGTSSVISSSSAVGLRAWAPAGAAGAAAIAAATEAATRASDSFTISSRLNLVSTSAAAISASSVRRVSSKMSAFCSFVIAGNCIAGTCIIAVESGVEEALALRSLLGGIMLAGD